MKHQDYKGKWTKETQEFKIQTKTPKPLPTQLTFPLIEKVRK